MLSEVERYERVLSGTFNRLITMAEQLQAAQIVQSQQGLDYTQADTKRGHWLGFATTGFAMIGALLCAIFGHPWVAGGGARENDHHRAAPIGAQGASGDANAECPQCAVESAFLSASRHRAHFTVHDGFRARALVRSLHDPQP